MPKPLSIDQFVAAKSAPIATNTNGASQGALSIEDFAKKKSTSTKKTGKKDSSLLKDIGVGITRLPVRASLNIGTAIDAARGILGNKEAGERAIRIQEQGIESPTYGEIRPIGMTGQGFGADVKDVFGAGLEASSYIPVARLPALGAQTIRQGIKQGAKTFAKEGAVAGGLAGAGTEMQRPESTLGSIAKSTAIGTGIGTLGGAVLGGATAAPLSAIALRAANRQKKVTDAIGRVLQGDMKDIETGRKALRQVDMSDVKTYKEGADRIREQIGAISRGVDDVLETDSTPRMLDTLSLKTTVGGETVEQNYVRQALNQLEEHYTKVNDIAKATQIKQLRQKAETVGLTLKEINNIARQHGVDLNAYNMNDELASGLKKQAVENTRKGVKATTRDLFGNNITKAADAEITALKRVEKLFNDMAEKVNDLQQRVMQRSLGAKVGRLAAQVLDVISGGFLKSFGRTLLIERGGGAQVFNALDLEKQLAKNLKLIQKAVETNASEQTIIQSLEQFIKNTTGKAPLLLPEKAGGAPSSILYGGKGGIAPTLQEAVDISGNLKAPKNSRAPKPNLYDEDYTFGAPIPFGRGTPKKSSGLPTIKPGSPLSIYPKALGGVPKTLPKKPSKLGVFAQRADTSGPFGGGGVALATKTDTATQVRPVTKTLTKSDQDVERKAWAKYDADPEAMLADFRSQFGTKVANADLARRLFQDVGYNGRNSAAVHEAASALNKDVWRAALRNPEPNAYIYAGGSGVGKSSAVGRLLPEVTAKGAAILDGNLSKTASAQARINEAIDAGKRPIIVYVYRDPVDAWVNGVVKRMRENAEEGGRVVPLSTFLENHPGSFNVVKDMIDAGISVRLIDNSLGPKKAQRMSRAKFNSLRYDSNELKAKLLEETKKLLEAEQITKDEYEALIR